MVVKFRGRITTCKDLLVPQRHVFTGITKSRKCLMMIILISTLLVSAASLSYTILLPLYLQYANIMETSSFPSPLVPSLSEGSLILFPVFFLLLQRWIDILSILGFKEFSVHGGIQLNELYFCYAIDRTILSSGF